jgi:alkylhydroperoxidase family enzyme
VLGVTQQMVDAIPSVEGSAFFTDEEKAVIAASTELTKTAKLSAATFERLRRFFDERGLVELVINTSIANLNNRVTDAFAADIEPD